MNLENEIINLCDKTDMNDLLEILSKLEKMKEELSN
jgi:hypothetical protein